MSLLWMKERHRGTHAKIEEYVSLDVTSYYYYFN